MEIKKIIKSCGTAMSLYTTSSTNFCGRNDVGNYFTSPQELLDFFKEFLEKRVEPNLLTIFHSQPSFKLEIVELINTL